MSLFESRAALEAADPFTKPWVVTDRTIRTVREAGDLIQVNVPYEKEHHPDWWDGDVFQLDTAGDYRYLPSSERWPTLRPGFTAYQRITT